jgi:cation transport ATPase
LNSNYRIIHPRPGKKFDRYNFTGHKTSLIQKEKGEKEREREKESEKEKEKEREREKEKERKKEREKEKEKKRKRERKREKERKRKRIYDDCKRLTMVFDMFFGSIVIPSGDAHYSGVFPQKPLCCSHVSEEIWSHFDILWTIQQIE